MNINESRPITLKDLIRKHARSYKYAGRGLIAIFFQQLNFRLELVATVIVVLAGLFFKITSLEWIIIIFSISLVLIAEALNSAIEAVCDAVVKEYNKEIRYAKDIGAGGVLLASIAAAIIGIIIFLPYLVSVVK